MLRLRLFGQPAIEQDGQLLTQLRSKKVEALLFYLAVNPGSQPRSQLADLLWPEQPEPKALGNLRYALWNLKQGIKNAPLEVDRLFVTFKPDESTQVDVLEFQQQVAKADAGAAGSPLQRAADLYRGDFLDGFAGIDSIPFNDWLRQQQTRYRDMAVSVLERLASYHANHYGFAEAISVNRRLLELDPWHEEVHRELMRLLALTGQRGAALAHFQQCRQMLASELGLEPELETVALAERIRRGTTQAEPAGPVRFKPGVEVSPFVGRAKEFAWLRARWDEVQPGDNRLVLVSGEMGVGKTRLVDEMLRAINLRGGLVLRGRSFEFSGPVAYQPVATALKSPLLRDDLRARGLSDVWLSELAQLVPELREKYPDLPPLALPAGADRYRLFEAVSQLVQVLSVRQPLLLFVDDLHWADSNTLDLLGYLVRRPAHNKTLVLGTYRPEEVSPAHPLAMLRDGLYRNRLVLELELDRLDRSSVAEMVQETAQATDTARLANFLYDVSEGNPFILIETLNEMQEQGQLDSPLPEKMVVVPREVRATLQQRLNRLSPPSRDLLQLAAVIGREFDTRLLVAAAGQPPETVASHLDDWLARGLIRADVPQSAAGVFDFSHDLIRAVEYQQLSLLRKEVLHRQVAAALEQLPDSTTRIEQLAFHTHHGRQHKKALHFFEQAAQKARSVYALSQALSYYQQALEHWHQLHTPDRATISERRRRWDLILAQVQIMRLQERWPEMQRMLAQLSQEVEKFGTDEDRLRVIVGQVLLLYRLRDLTGCRLLAGEGLALAGQLVDQLAEGLCYQALGGCALVETDYQQALADFEAALINFAQSGHTYEAGRCLNRIAETYLITNQFRQALACLKEARAYAKAGRYQDILIAALLLQARVCLYSGEIEQAAVSVEKALDLSQSIGFLQPRPEGYGLSCLIHLWTGDLEKAQQASRRALAVLTDLGDEQATARAVCLQGLLQLASDDPAAATQSLNAANTVDDYYQMERLSYLAMAQRALGRLDTSLQFSEQAVDLLVARNCGLEAAQRIYLNHYHVLQTAGQREAAEVALLAARKMVAQQSAGLDRRSRKDFLTGLPWNREIAATRPARGKQTDPQTG